MCCASRARIQAQNLLQIMEDIDHYDIPVYNFPYDVEEDDEDTIQDNSELRVCVQELELTFPGLSHLVSL